MNGYTDPRLLDAGGAAGTTGALGRRGHADPHKGRWRGERLTETSPDSLERLMHILQAKGEKGLADTEHSPVVHAFPKQWRVPEVQCGLKGDEERAQAAASVRGFAAV